jgi:hypothetical protein
MVNNCSRKKTQIIEGTSHLITTAPSIARTVTENQAMLALAMSLLFSQQVPTSTPSAHASPAQKSWTEAAFGDIPSPQYMVPLTGLAGFAPAAHVVLAQVAAAAAVQQ